MLVAPVGPPTICQSGDERTSELMSSDDVRVLRMRRIDVSCTMLSILVGSLALGADFGCG
jgi:hypothetical protein